jgi:hypothetical protein
VDHSLSPPRDLGAVDSVLDVGCGIRPQQIVDARRYVGVDAHKPYLDALIESGAAGPPGVHFMHGEWDTVLGDMKDGEFDMVVALDFIEHLERDAGFAFVAEAQRVGRSVVIFTPLGECPQHYAPGESDQWGMDGGRWQNHRSAWRPEDFPGWETHVLPEFHAVDANQRKLPEPIGAFWAIKES